MNAVHWHLVLNHFPIIGSVLGTLLVAVAFAWRRDRGVLLAAAVLLVVAGATAVATNLTGEPAEEAVEHLAGVLEATIEPHEELAEVATVVAVLTALVAVATSLFDLARKDPLRRKWVLPLLAAGIVATALMAQVGWTGGKIRHTELGNAADPLAGSILKV